MCPSRFVQAFFSSALVAVVAAACARGGPRATTVARLPSESIAEAESLGALGRGEAGLAVLTDALCRRAAGERRDSLGVSEQTAAALDVRLVNAWVSLWDVAGRPGAPIAAVTACYGSAPVSLLLAVALADASGDWQRALELAEQRDTVDQGGALREPSRPLAAELALRHSVALLHLGQMDAALEELRANTRQFGDHFGLKLALAQAELAAGRPEAVGEALWPMLRQPVAIDHTLLGRARALMQAAREAAAPPLTPADAAEYADLTRLLNAGDWGPDDIAHVRHLARAAYQPQLFSWCALLLFKHGDTHLARRLLGRAQRALPLDPTPLRLLAAQQMSADDYDAALVSLIEAIRRDPFDVEHQAMLAHVAERVGNRPQMRAALEALVRLLPGDTDYFDKLEALRAASAADAGGSRP